jgi:chloramphenicol 3-O phosphotransferase
VNLIRQNSAPGKLPGTLGQKNMRKTIIVDGVSSAGCTSLVKKFCELTNEEYQRLHVDEFTTGLPKDVQERRNSDKGWTEITIAFNHHIVSVLKQYDKVIAETLYKLPLTRNHLFNILGRENIFYVQMFCGLEELERREVIRGDRPKGLARSQFSDVYSFSEYDIQLDSSNLTLEKCCTILLEKVSSPSYLSDHKNRASD